MKVDRSGADRGFWKRVASIGGGGFSQKKCGFNWTFYRPPPQSVLADSRDSEIITGRSTDCDYLVYNAISLLQFHDIVTIKAIRTSLIAS